MRIVIATDLYLPVVGGVTTFSRNLAHKLAEHGHEVLVIAPSRTGRTVVGREDNYRLAGVASIPLPIFNYLRLAINPYSSVKQLVDTFRPDVIHVQTQLGIGWSALRAGKRHRIAVVATNHVIPENLIENLKLLAPFTRSVHRILKQYGHLFHERADYVTMPTQTAIDMVKKDSFKVPVVPLSNGIDLTRFSPGTAPAALRQKFSIKSTDEVLLYVGRLDSEKKLGSLIVAMSYIKSAKPVKLLVVGTGNDEANLKSLVSELELEDRVIFTGYVEDGLLPDIYKLAKVFIMPSPAELQSIATLEAMATGLAVVAVDAGALPELCHNGINGWLATTGDSQDLAQKIQRALKNKAKLKAMGQASIKIANNHDLETVSKQYEALYMQVQQRVKAMPRRTRRVSLNK